MAYALTWLPELLKAARLKVIEANIVRDVTDFAGIARAGYRGKGPGHPAGPWPDGWRRGQPEMLGGAG
ncbi:hypothetical protein ABC974_12625 [Sphingomonas oligophenolica]|uniref:Uncharacterized protein n=1 Tax=Sphingomonas oligophenolica TaxID=301154 RepID=A0ABU9Y3V6_9SPHN